MSDKFFLDTNILVYTFDQKAKNKREIARKLVTQALSSASCAISYQVLQEFLNVATRKFKRPLSAVDAETFLTQALAPLCEIYPSTELYLSALLISTETGYSFYDSLIIAAAIEANCSILYTDDLQDNQRISNLQIINPFK